MEKIAAEEEGTVSIFSRILFLLYFNIFSAFNNFKNNKKRFMFIDHQKHLK